MVYTLSAEEVRIVTETFLAKVSDAIECAAGHGPVARFVIGGGFPLVMEHYIARLGRTRLPAMEQTVLVAQFGGKKVASVGMQSDLVSLPSLTTMLPIGRTSDWQIPGVINFAVVYFTGDAGKVINQMVINQVEPVSFTSPLANQLIRALLDLVTGVHKVDAEHQQAIAAALFHQVKFDLETGQHCTPLHTTSIQNQHVATALDYIGRNLDKPLAARDIAEHVGLSPDHFRRLFARITGNSLHQYVLVQRLEKAREMVTDTDLALTTIAADTGFSSQSHMTTRFREHYNATPAEFRRRR